MKNLIILLKKIYFKLDNFFKESEKISEVYFSYQNAIDSCDSYVDEDLIKVVAAKGKAFKENFKINKDILTYDFNNFQIKRLVNLISMLNIKDKNINILDFGGGSGHHYYLVQNLINSKFDLNWIVFETKELTKECKDLGLESNNLKFVSSFDDIRNLEFDVIYSNYAISYTDDPYTYLTNLLNLNFKKFYMTNTSIGEFDEDYIIGIQESDLKTNGIGRDIPQYLNISNKKIRYPFTIMNRLNFEKIINQNSDIIYTIKEQDSAYKTAKGNFDLYGILVESRLN